MTGSNNVLAQAEARRGDFRAPSPAAVAALPGPTLSAVAHGPLPAMSR